MCDETTETENATLTRRHFAALSAAAAGVVLLPTGAFAGKLTEREVVIETPAGMADAYFVHPTTAAPGVLIWPDILGLRPAFRTMAKRLAGEGYAVLVVNPFYRNAKAPVVGEGASYRDEAVRKVVQPMAKALSAETHEMDARAFVGFLDAQKAVDPSKKLGTTGYCMGGPIVLRTASTLPSRIGAAATFHGGGLVTKDTHSPHLGIPAMKAQVLIAVASNDDARDPLVTDKLKAAFDKAKLKAEVEVYADAMHGWCPPDSAVYHPEQAEKAWGRLLAVFGEALKG